MRPVLAGLRLGKLDLLLHQRSVLLEVNILVIEFILFLFELAPHLVVLLLQLESLHLILLLLLIEGLLLARHHVPLRLNLVLEGDLRALKLRRLLDHQLVLFEEFASLHVVSLLLLIHLELMRFLLPFERLHLLCQLLIVGFELLAQESDLAILRGAGLVQ